MHGEPAETIGKTLGIAIAGQTVTALLNCPAQLSSYAKVTP